MSAEKIITKDDVPCQIEEGLFLGSFDAANNKRALKSLNVTHVLTVANSLPPSHPDDFKYKLIGVQDRGDVHIAQYFNECFEFIEEAKGTGSGVLVHCLMGRSRSVSIVVAYLMRKHGMSVSQALDHVESKRPVAAPNTGFMLQLQKFEKLLQVRTAHSEMNEQEVESPDNSAKGLFIQCTNILNLMELDNTLYFKVLMTLKADVEWREWFMANDDVTRRIWMEYL